MINSIKEFLLEKDYFVSVQQTELGCITSFPIQKEQLDTSYVLSYVEPGVKSGLLINDNFVEAAPYAIRLLVLADVFYKCNVIHYDPEVVVYFDMTGKTVPNGGLAMIKAVEDQDELTKESILSTIVASALNNGWNQEHKDLANQQKMLESYLLLQRYFGGYHE